MILLAIIPMSSLCVGGTEKGGNNDPQGKVLIVQKLIAEAS